MNAHKVETVLSEDGTLMLKGLPFHAGDAVEVIILERGGQSERTVAAQEESNLFPLRGTVLHYEEPFEPAVPLDDWEVLR
ncbi:MAG: hypothetical protein LH702_25765 [Phormidesmis sp. CAN_BIN44]|nr:hypothetical protein [Phormidesmis sp. CAN_BIN44]